jgi:serine/threonine protein kinase
MLVFKGGSGKRIVKLTDFGYAMSSGNDTYLPYTWPWVAPEWHPRPFGLLQAKKADIYSFGMTCLWLLFANSPAKVGSMTVSEAAMPPDETSQRTAVDLMRQGDDLPDFARKLVNRAACLNDEQRDRLIRFFDSTIRLDPNLRQLDLQEISKFLELE